MNLFHNPLFLPLVLVAVTLLALVAVLVVLVVQRVQAWRRRWAHAAMAQHRAASARLESLKAVYDKLIAEQSQTKEKLSGVLRVQIINAGSATTG